MADDALTVIDASGTTRTLRSRDVGSGKQGQKIDVGPWVPTPTGAPVTFTVASTASGVDGGGTYNIPDDTTHVIITVEAFPIRITEDGTTAPTATLGLLLPVGSIIEMGNARNLNYIGVGGTARVNLAPRKYI